jgi:ubiquinone/menaquinone biosynthesis C-methylase UbiE
MSFVFQPGTKFLDPERILFQSGLGKNQVVADLGAGSGFYAVASGKIVGNGGSVYVVDIMESALNHVSSEARLKGLRNIKTIRADLEQPGAVSAIPSGSADLVIFANVLHQVKNREKLLADAYSLLKTGGKVLAVEWNDEVGTFGPPAVERISENEIKQLASKKSLKFTGRIDTDKYHYGLIFVK